MGLIVLVARLPGLTSLLNEILELSRLATEAPGARGAADAESNVDSPPWVFGEALA